MANGWQQKLSQVNWPFTIGMVFFLTVLISMIWGYNRIVDWLMDEKQVPLRHVVVSGDLRYANPKLIETKVLGTKIGSFFNVDVNQVQQDIEALSWVYRVSVRKKWPDILTVHVTEQQPVARWNDEALVNVHGEVFNAELPNEAVLPRLYGPKGSAFDALKGFRDMSSLLTINGFDIEALELSARFSWQLTLNNGVSLKLGREKTVERVQRFIDLYSVIEQRKPEKVQSIDLRYDTGMAVSWYSTEGKKSS